MPLTASTRIRQRANGADTRRRWQAHGRRRGVAAGLPLASFRFTAVGARVAPRVCATELTDSARRAGRWEPRVHLAPAGCAVAGEPLRVVALESRGIAGHADAEPLAAFSLPRAGADASEAECTEGPAEPTSVSLAQERDAGSVDALKRAQAGRVARGTERREGRADAAQRIVGRKTSATAALRGLATRGAIRQVAGRYFTVVQPAFQVGISVTAQLGERGHASAHARRGVVRSRRAESELAADLSSLSADRRIPPPGVTEEENVARLLDRAELVRIVGAQLADSTVAGSSRVGGGRAVGSRSRRVRGTCIFVECAEQNVRSASRDRAEHERREDPPCDAALEVPDAHLRPDLPSDQRALSTTRCAWARNRPCG